MNIRDHITKEWGCYLLPMLKRVTLLHKYKLCKIYPIGKIYFHFIYLLKEVMDESWFSLI